MTHEMSRRGFIASTSGLGLTAMTAGTFEAEFIQSNGLSRWLTAQIAQFPAKAGVYIKHLATGEEGGVHEDDLFNSMSVIKLGIMVRAYQLVDQKKLNLDDRIEIQETDLRGGSGILRQFDVPHAVTFRDVITQMVITSDNTATDIALARVGGLDTLNGWIEESGYTFSMTQDLHHYFRKPFEFVSSRFGNLSPLETFVLGTTPRQPRLLAMRAPLVKELDMVRSGRARSGEPVTRPVEDQTGWLGRMTPRGIARLVEDIHAGKVASKESCDDMDVVMRRQTAGSRRIPHFLTVPVAHKTGDNRGAGVANDVGIVYAKSGPILMSFFTLGAVKEYGELEDRVGRMARNIVDYFDGAV
jgi:beta-lactamase class A